MADELGAVRRTPRPAGDRQTPETGPSADASATITPSSVSGDHPGVREDVSGELSPEVAAALVEQHGPEIAALSELGAHILNITSDLQAYAELPECTACDGSGKDDHATVFEAPYAVHFAGMPVKAEGRRRQLCMWCGHVLSDLPSRKGEPLPPAWLVGTLIQIEDGDATEVDYEPGGELPPGCCALPDDEEPTPGPGCYPPADGWDGVSIAVDPNDGYPVDLCGKHTGNCSNRCLLPAHHDGECDDDPVPDEAQETRAADWPAEPQGGDRCGAGCGNGPEDSCWHSEED